MKQVLKDRQFDSVAPLSEFAVDAAVVVAKVAYYVDIKLAADAKEVVESKEDNQDSCREGNMEMAAWFWYRCQILLKIFLLEGFGEMV